MELLLLIIGLLTYLIYVLYVRPIRLKAHYSKLFRDLGYKVYEKPYQMHTAPFYDQFYQDEKTHRNYGNTGMNVLSDSYDIYLTNVINKPMIFFMNEKLITDFLTKQDICTKVPINYDLVKFTVLRSLTFMEKEGWKHRRKIISKVFKYQIIASQIQQMVQVANQIFEKYQTEYWTTRPQKQLDQKLQINLFQLLTSYSSAIVMTGFLGLRSMNSQLKGKALYEQVSRLTNQTTFHSRDLLVKLFGLNFFKLGLRKSDRDILELNREVNDILMGFIRQYRQELTDDSKAKYTEKSIVHLILQEILKEKQKGQKLQMTDEDLVDQMKAFVIAGSETVSNYLTILILNIFQEKEVFKRLKMEINQHIKSDDDITAENLKNIQYLNHVLTQTSRMYPMIEFMFQRQLNEDTLINGIPISKGTMLNYYSKPLLFNKKIFKDPFVFRPERWEEQNEGNKYLARIVSFQFSGGSRSCIGKVLTLTEAKVMVVKFVRRYQSLIQPEVQKRVIKMEIVGHVENSNVILTKSY